MTDRGVSVALSYVLTLAITTLLISGLLFATANVVGDRQESVTRTELQVVGERVSASLMTADRLVQSGASTVIVEVPAPQRVAGEGYSIALNATGGEVVLSTGDPAVVVRVPFRNETVVATSEANGGDVEIVFADDGELEVRSA